MAEAHKRAYRHPKYKTSHRVKNWPEYEKSLRNLGGHPIYSDIAIETSLTLRLVFHFPLRQAEGFLKSILKLMDLYLPCPDYTTVSRRNRSANIRRYTRGLPDGPVYFIVDSTDLKIFGQGEWHSKKHGERWRKHWKKLHLGVDENSRILASKVTDGHEHDPSQVPDLLIQVDREIDRFVGGGIYDQEAVYEAVDHHSPGAEVIVPPRKDAVLSHNSISVPSYRDRHIAEIRSKGWSEWKHQSGYYLQSRAENAFYRYKRIIGGRLRAKNDGSEAGSCDWLRYPESDVRNGCTFVVRGWKELFVRGRSTQVFDSCNKAHHRLGFHPLGEDIGEVERIDKFSKARFPA